MKHKRLYDAEQVLWSIIQSYGYKLDAAMAYKLADEHFKKYNPEFDLIENYDPEEEKKKLVDKFLAWPLPESVCSDACVTFMGYKRPRSGTNLLTADEAKQLFDYLFMEDR